MGWERTGLHEISDLDRDEIEELLDSAAAWRSRVRQADGSLRASTQTPLSGHVVFNLFFESSTRTRVSFERAAGLLGAQVIHFDASRSSVNKGETLGDTITTLEAMRPDAIVVRHAEDGASRVVDAHTRAGVVNAGDGSHAHPTQALLDALTMRDRFGKIDGLKVVVTGDVLHSRVARSTGVCLRALGAQVTLVGPEGLAPADRLASLGLAVSHDLDGALRGADVAYMLRIQLERHDREGTAGVPEMDDYRAGYQLDARRLGLLSKRGVVMHPGPVNRGVELSDEVMEDERSLIWDQVASGVFVRMAVLEAVGRRRYL